MVLLFAFAICHLLLAICLPTIPLQGSALNSTGTSFTYTVYNVTGLINYLCMVKNLKAAVCIPPFCLGLALYLIAIL
jgi:hypothetical protein